MAKKLLCVFMLILMLVCTLASCDGGETTPENDDALDNDNTSENEDNQEHTHSFDNWETVKAATCTAEGLKERYCSCGEKQTAKISNSDIPHIFSQKVTEETYLKSEATYTSSAIYYYSCTCGAIGTEEFESGQPLKGDLAEGVYVGLGYGLIKVKANIIYFYDYKFQANALLEYAYTYSVNDYEISFVFDNIRLLNADSANIDEYNNIKNAIKEDASKAYLYGRKTSIKTSGNSIEITSGYNQKEFAKITTSYSSTGDLVNGFYLYDYESPYGGPSVFLVDGDTLYDFSGNNGCIVARTYKYEIEGERVNLEFQAMILINQNEKTLEAFEGFKDYPNEWLSDSETVEIFNAGFKLINTKYGDQTFIYAS